jgi:hypothetical protein
MRQVGSSILLISNTGVWVIPNFSFFIEDSFLHLGFVLCCDGSDGLYVVKVILFLVILLRMG